MKVNVTTFEKVCIGFLILCNLSIVKIIPFFTRNFVTLITLILTLTLFGLLLLTSQNSMNKYYTYLIGYLIIMLLIEYLFSIIKYNYSFLDCFRISNRFFYLTLGPVIFNMLIRDSKYMDRLCMFIIFFTSISAFMRILLSVYWTRTGIYLFSDMLYEFWPGGIRNGVLRVNFPCFVTMFIPLFFYEFIKSGNRKKILLLICLAIFEYFILRVQLSRSALIYQVFIFTFLWLVKKKSGIKQFLLIIFVGIVILCLLNSEYVINLLQSFDASGSLRYSTSARLLAVSHYGKLFIDNPLFGMGFIYEDDALILPGLGNISDIGILGGVFHFGIFGILMYLFLYVRWGYIAFKLYKRKKYNYFTLVIGFIISSFVWGISIEPMYGLIIFSLPFMSGICEYLLYRKD